MPVSVYWNRTLCLLVFTRPSHSYSKEDKIDCVWSKRDELKLYCDLFLTTVLSFIVLGRKNENACKGARKTCSLLDKFPETTGCRRGQVPRMFSVLGRAQSVIRGINGNAHVYKETVISFDPLNASFFTCILIKHNVMPSTAALRVENVQCL